MRRLYYFCALLLMAWLSGCQPQEQFFTAFESPKALQTYLRWTPSARPLVSAHRGGPLPGYPENCLETFENSLRYAPCLIECDVRKTADDVLVLMHDESLERTTTGRGAVSRQTLAALQGLWLKDPQGKVTRFRIPTLSETLDWARSRAILTLDVKPGVSPEEIVAAISAHDAAAYTVIITYSLAAAERYHALNPDLMISAPAEGYENVRKLLSSKIDPRCLMAFVGVVEPDRELYDQLHRQGIRAILGTMGNLDRRAQRRGRTVYVELLRNGADVLATDNVPLAARAVADFVKMMPAVETPVSE